MIHKRVLITGINGFTGGYVAERLQTAGYEISGIGSQARYGGPLRDISYQQADLMSAEAVSRAVATIDPTHVIHLAAVAFVGHGDPSAFYAVNLLGTRNLLMALRKRPASLSRVILASSANVYGVSQGGALSEDAVAAPANDYAVSKLAMEYLAKTFAADLPIVIARPFNYTGRGQSEDFLIAKCVGHFRRRVAAIELGNLDVSRDFSDVRSLADAYLGLTETAPIGATVNICSGVPHSLRDVLNFAREISGHEIEVRVNPAFIRQNEIRSLTGDPALLKKLVPSFQSIPLRETIRWMLDEPVRDQG